MELMRILITASETLTKWLLSMKFFKKLKSYNKEEASDAIIGFGILKAMDYDKFKKGHLVLFSLNISSVSFLKKIFIAL